LSIAASNWTGSTWQCHRPDAQANATSIASPAARRRKPSETICNADGLRRERAAPCEGEKLLRDLGGVLGRNFGTVEQLP
jgi:hypothetical protein